ncbi:hypothetical protein DFJ63DRAFT_333266 [Scheffersomyces coipomensis]|uniref:uncharacterized protein n=1 Tax=Scheffersomyces coipomensis TaxID=1788519 RepID=UPI00315DF420
MSTAKLDIDGVMTIPDLPAPYQLSKSTGTTTVSILQLRNRLNAINRDIADIDKKLKHKRVKGCGYYFEIAFGVTLFLASLGLIIFVWVTIAQAKAAKDAAGAGGGQ